MKKIAASLFLFAAFCLALPYGHARIVKLESVTIEKQSLPVKVTAIDAAGHRRAFSEVYIVKIKGRIPVHDAMPVELLIGDVLAAELVQLQHPRSICDCTDRQVNPDGSQSICRQPVFFRSRLSHGPSHSTPILTDDSAYGVIQGSHDDDIVFLSDKISMNVHSL